MYAQEDGRTGGSSTVPSVRVRIINRKVPSDDAPLPGERLTMSPSSHGSSCLCNEIRMERRLSAVGWRSEALSFGSLQAGHRCSASLAAAEEAMEAEAAEEAMEAEAVEEATDEEAEAAEEEAEAEAAEETEAVAAEAAAAEAAEEASIVVWTPPPGPNTSGAGSGTFSSMHSLHRRSSFSSARPHCFLLNSSRGSSFLQHMSEKHSLTGA